MILYSIECPKCKILERKLTEEGFDYTIINDIEIMRKKGISSLPVLEIGNVLYNFNEAIKYINNKE